MFCTCVITDSTLVDLYPPFGRHLHTWIYTLMNMYTQPHTCTCNTKIWMYIYAHNTTHTCTHNTMCTQDGCCPLHVASQEGHDRIVEMLLQGGATVDLQNKVENCSSVTYHLCCAMWLFVHWVPHNIQGSHLGKQMLIIMQISCTDLKATLVRTFRAILAYSMTIPYWDKDMRTAILTESESHVSFPMPHPASFPLSAILTVSEQKLAGSPGTSLLI